MKGWLVVNGFLKSKKFDEIYGCLLNSAKNMGIELILKYSDQLGAEVFGGGFSHVDGKGVIHEDFPQFVLFWDKDVYLAKRLEALGARVFNCAHAIEACDNKILTFLSLEGKIPLAKTIVAPKTFEGVGFGNFEFLHKAIDILGLPMVIKEAFGSFGQQVFLAKTVDEAEKIVKNIGTKDFLMQQFVSTSCGRDIRINVVGGRVIASMLRTNEGDFRANISNGGKMQQVDISRQQAEVAISACQLLKLDFAGVDVLFGQDDQPILCEVNSNPHFKSTLACTGIDLSVHILQHIVDTIN